MKMNQVYDVMKKNLGKCIKWIREMIKKICVFLKKKIISFVKWIKPELVETTITVRTKYLQKQVQELCSFNLKLALIAIFSAFLTAITTLGEYFSPVQDYFKGNMQGIFPYMEFVLCLISVIMMVLSIVCFFKERRTYNSINLVNEIIKDQYDVEEHTAIFIIKTMFDNVPKILVFKSETWESYFLPYCHYNQNESDVEIKEKLKLTIAEQLEVNESDFEIYDDFSENKYVAIKKNPSHNSMSKINYRFYYIVFKNIYMGRRFLDNNIQHFTWKSKYELLKDKDTQLNNGDVVGIIDELSLINQSKLAFQERKHSSYELTSHYNIIWNITNECYYECPICATCSSSSCKCDVDYEKKLNILMNLASISGNIAKLDISGGDPLKNEVDRKIIKKAHQILAFTDVKVTTTGMALENISINEAIETVKKCDITYDIPYEVCEDKLQEYREYNYNYYNYRLLERFSNSGIKIELNIHIPILPVNIDKTLISMILEDLNSINPAEIKFIRLMPVGRMDKKKITQEYLPQRFIDMVNTEMLEKNYKFNITYNCSLGSRIKRRDGDEFKTRNCSMLEKKLGIDCNGRVYSCIWGAYIEQYIGDNYRENPFYLGDLNNETMNEILTKPKTIKLLKLLKDKNDGCRVCAFVEACKDGEFGDKSPRQIMIEAPDPMQEFYEPIK